MCQRRIPSAQWHQPRKCVESIESESDYIPPRTKNGFLPLKDMESWNPKIAFQSSSRDLVEFYSFPQVCTGGDGMDLGNSQGNHFPNPAADSRTCLGRKSGQNLEKSSNFVQNFEERFGLGRSCNHFKYLNIRVFSLNHQDSGVAHPC